MRDKCYYIPTKDGQSVIRIRAEKRPDARTTKALQELFEVAQRHLEKVESERSRIIKVGR